MIVQNLPLVAFVVGKMSDESGSSPIDREDALAYGIEGLIQAVDNYDPERGTTFASFAIRRLPPPPHPRLDPGRDPAHGHPAPLAAHERSRGGAGQPGAGDDARPLADAEGAGPQAEDAHRSGADHRRSQRVARRR